MMSSGNITNFNLCSRIFRLFLITGYYHLEIVYIQDKILINTRFIIYCSNNIIVLINESSIDGHKII